MKQIVRKAALPAALAVGLGGAATVLDALRDPVPSLGAQAAPEVVREAEDLATAFRSASKAALPGVVFVEVEAAPRAVGQTVPEQYRGTPLERFFGVPQQPQRPRMGSGSGFIISPNGYVLTNNHVVEQASRVTVTLTDKREFVAEVVGRDPNTDVAVLKIDGQDLPTVRLGTAEGLQVGDWVLALGYPLSLGETVTAGIVSAMGKSINILASDEEADAPLEHFIQTDAAINPGNSGGPLVNLRGEVVGINTAIASPTGTYSGYGFAVPIHLAKRVADDLIRYGAVHRPKLGVQIKDVQPADVEVFGLPDARGAVVATLPEGPARDAGVRLGDVIVAVDGEPVGDTGELMEEIALLQPGDRVELGLIRYGKPARATVKLGSFAAVPAPRATGADVREADALVRLGFAAVEVTPSIGRELGFERAEGVVVTGLDPLGPAAQAGLARGHRVERLNRDLIRSLADLRRAAAALRPGATASIIARLPDGEQTIVNFRLHG